LLNDFAAKNNLVGKKNFAGKSQKQIDFCFFSKKNAYAAALNQAEIQAQIFTARMCLKAILGSSIP